MSVYHLYLCVAASMAIGPAVSGAGESEEEDRRASVARIYCRDGGNTLPATAFVIERPSDRKRLLITAAHAVEGKEIIDALLHNSDTKFQCEVIDSNIHYDVAALSPINYEITAPPLQVLDIARTVPKVLNRITLIAGDSGASMRIASGEIDADPEKAATLYRDVFGPIEYKKALQPLAEDAILVRHGVECSNGASGGPILNESGVVIGIHHGLITKARTIKFGIHARHIAELRLDQSAKEYRAKHKNATTLINQFAVSATERQVGQPVRVRFGDEMIDARPLRNDSVPNDRQLLERKFVQDVNTFRNSFRLDLLEPFLAAQEISQVTCDAYGFSFLLPRRLTARPIQFKGPPEGIAISVGKTASSGESANTIAMIYAFSVADIRRKAEKAAKDGLEEGTFIRVADDPQAPGKRELYEQILARNILVDMLLAGFQRDVLSLRIRSDDGSISNGESRNVFRRLSLNESFASNETTWSNVEYVAEEESVGYLVSCAIRRNVCVVIERQYDKTDRDNYAGGRDVSRRFLEQAFIRSTLSMY